MYIYQDRAFFKAYWSDPKNRSDQIICFLSIFIVYKLYIL